MLGAILTLLISGLIIGLLARFAVPGKDPLPIWAVTSFLFALGGAVVLLILYRRLVQKRSLTGPS